MSTSYSLVCFTCKSAGPSFASGSIAYGYKVWNTDEWFKWLGHGEPSHPAQEGPALGGYSAEGFWTR